MKIHKLNHSSSSSSSSLPHSAHTASGGTGSSSATPAHRVWNQRPQWSQLTMRSPSSSCVPHARQSTTQSSMPPEVEFFVVVVAHVVVAAVFVVSGKGREGIRLSPYATGLLGALGRAREKERAGKRRRKKKSEKRKNAPACRSVASGSTFLAVAPASHCSPDLDEGDSKATLETTAGGSRMR